MAQLHYRPDNGWFGDPITFYWDGIYHVFYLRSYPNGSVCWGHIASDDLVNWNELPDAISNGPEKVDEGGCLTGSIIERDGIFHAFYTGCGSMGATVCHATSHDLVIWTKDKTNPILLPDLKWYSDEAWRDACVMWNSEDNCYWMVICARTSSDGINPLNGCLALATSTDLHTWTTHPPAWSPKMSTAVECPDLFFYKGKWVLLYFWHETRLALADSSKGPWKRPIVQAPDGFDFFAGKTLWDGHRRVLIGYIPRRSCDCAERIGGGNMLLPRELYFLADGTPATRCIPEIINAHSVDATDGRGAQVFAPSMSEWNITPNTANVILHHGQSALACWADAPADYYFHTEITFASGSSAIIMLRCQSAEGTEWRYNTPLDAGYALYLDPVESTVILRKWYQWDQRTDLIKFPYSFLSEQPTSIELFLHGDILEVFLDERRSLVSRLLQHPCGSLSLLAKDGQVIFDNVNITEHHK